MVSASETTTTMSDNQFRTQAALWLEANVPSQWREHRGALSEEDETSLRRLWDQRLHAGGYSGLSLPKEYGGQGLGLAEEVAFHELAAQAQAPDGLARLGKILTAPTLITHGSDYQKQAYLPKILSGEHVWCQGFSEPGSGSDLASVTCFARRVEGGYVVRGTKTWTSFSWHSHRCLLLARTDEQAPKYRNLSMLLLDMQQAGVVISPIREISGGSHFSETFFDDVFVADEDRLGADGDGWRMAMAVLTHERGTVEAITRFVEIRADMDLLIGCCARDTATLDSLHDLDAQVDLVRWQVSKAVARSDDQAAYDRASMVLKVWWSELWQEITSVAARTSCPRHRSHWRSQYLESRAATIYSGTSEVQRNIISERVLGLPK